MITKLEQFKESKLVPRNVEGRKEKLRQQNLRLLQQEVIEGDLLVDDLWDFLPDQVRTRTVNGNVTLKVTNKKIPQWLENVTVNGNFRCSANQLTSLEGCPKTVNGFFNCSYNQLISLEGCPKTVNGFFDCLNNQLISLEGCPQTIGLNFHCSYNQLTSLKGCPETVGGDFYCLKNAIKFTEKDIPKDTVIKGEIFL